MHFGATAIQQNYCIYTQLFEIELQAPKTIKFAHKERQKLTRLI